MLWNLVPLAQRLWPARGGQRPRRAPLLRTYRRAEACPPALVERLREAYREDIEATGRLVGRDLSHWLHPPAPAVSTAHRTTISVNG